MSAGLILALKHWRAILGGLGFLVLGLMLVSARSDARHWQKVAESCATARKLEQAAIQTKTAEAKAADAANVVRVVTAQTKVNQEVSHDYQADIASARRRAAERVRGASTDHPRGSGPAPDPAAGDATGRPDGAAIANGLSDPERLECTEIALRLKYLQEWELKQQAIPLDDKSPPG